MVSLEFFIGIFLPIALWIWGRINPKWVPGVFPGGKDGRCVMLTTLPPSWAIVTLSGNLNFLEPSGHLGPVMGLLFIFLWRPTNTYDHISLSLSKNEIYFGSRCREYQNIFYIPWSFFFLNYAVYDKMWENILEPRRPHITICRMLITCWIRKATDTHSEYVTF